MQDLERINQYTRSSTLEKLLEHLFVGELLRCLWRHGIRDFEVLRAEVDAAGYDLVLEANGVMRHVQLKSSYRGARTARVGINSGLAAKPSGCVLWIRFDPGAMELGPFLWFGGAPGARLPPLGERVGRHSKANAAGVKTSRPGIRILSRGQFEILPTMEAVVEQLFGIQVDRVS